MSAPLGRTPEKPLGRCECADPDCLEDCAGDDAHWDCTYWPGKFRRCTRDAVRLVWVRRELEVDYVAMGAQGDAACNHEQVAMCSECGEHYESRVRPNTLERAIKDIESHGREPFKFQEWHFAAMQWAAVKIRRLQEEAK